MTVWLVRAGKHGEDENVSLEQSVAIIGWHELPDVSSTKSYADMKELHAKVYPDMNPMAIQNNAAQLWAFVRRIEKGDIIVLPLKTQSKVAIGTITGDYAYVNGRHTRKVKWQREDVPRNDFGQDLLYSLGAFMTVCQITRNNALERLKVILAGKVDPNKGGIAKVADGAAPNTEEGAEGDLVNLEEQAIDQIRLLIEARFKGHGLARIVQAILSAEGFQTVVSPVGKDGGIDILAAHGTMGFESPKICVQVKSGGVQNDGAIRELEGVMGRVGAEKGLFVSWDGYNKEALAKERDLFFKVRLWDDKELISKIVASYDKLPEEIQTELPLKQIWVVVPEDDR